MALLDYRSDTVTKPTKGMLDAMFSAKVGDDVFGDDPSVNALQDYAAQLFGLEAALFCPSGTMTNQIAIMAHTKPGDEVICDALSHIYLYEGGGIARNAGCSVALLQGDHGRINAEMARSAIRADDPHFPRTSLISLENTCNKGGGVCYDFTAFEEIRQLCNEKHLNLHLDGARLMNAIVAKNEKPQAYGEVFDTISLCLSKGLGAPVGSLLLGSNAFIKQAKRLRKVVGGGMRQAGYLAAAGLYALKHQVYRLADDHTHALLLAEGLNACSMVRSVATPSTNIVIGHCASESTLAHLLEKLKEQDILAVPFGPTSLRMVTHLDLSHENVLQTINILKKI